jgi:hypothetical protein
MNMKADNVNPIVNPIDFAKGRSGADGIYDNNYSSVVRVHGRPHIASYDASTSSLDATQRRAADCGPLMSRLF